MTLTSRPLVPHALPMRSVVTKTTHGGRWQKMLSSRDATRTKPPLTFGVTGGAPISLKCSDVCVSIPLPETSQLIGLFCKLNFKPPPSPRVAGVSSLQNRAQLLPERLALLPSIPSVIKSPALGALENRKSPRETCFFTPVRNMRGGGAFKPPGSCWASGHTVSHEQWSLSFLGTHYSSQC